MRARNWALFLLVAFLWGSNWSASKTCLGLVPPITLRSHQFLFSAIALSPFLLFLRHEFPKDGKTLRRMIVFSLLNISSMVLMNISLVYESSGIGAVLMFTQPLIVFGLAVLFLNEKVSALRLSGVLVGFLGVSMLSFRGSGPLPFSHTSLIMIFGAFFWASAIVYYKKYLSHANAMVVNAFQFLFGFFPLVALSEVFERFTFPLNNVYLGLLLYVSLGTQVVGLTIWLYLLGDEEATSLSASGFLVPMIALFFGWWLLGEGLDTWSLLGSSLILAGLYLVNRVPRNKG